MYGDEDGELRDPCCMSKEPQHTPHAHAPAALVSLSAIRKQPKHQGPNTRHNAWFKHTHPMQVPLETRLGTSFCCYSYAQNQLLLLRSCCSLSRLADAAKPCAATCIRCVFSAFCGSKQQNVFIHTHAHTRLQTTRAEIVIKINLQSLGTVPKSAIFSPRCDSFSPASPKVCLVDPIPPRAPAILPPLPPPPLLAPE